MMQARTAPMEAQAVHLLAHPYLLLTSSAHTGRSPLTQALCLMTSGWEGMSGCSRGQTWQVREAVPYPESGHALRFIITECVVCSSQMDGF